MEDTNPNTQQYDDEKEDFQDALDDFIFYDCEKSFVDRIESNGGVSISEANINSPCGDEILTPANSRRRRSLSHHKSSVEVSTLSSPVCVEKYLNSRDRKLRLSRTIKNYEKKLDSENSGVELQNSLESEKDIGSGDNIKKNEDSSTLTDANFSNKGEDIVREELVEKNGESSILTDTNSNSRGGNLVRNELDLRANQEALSFILTLAGLIIRAITFQVNLLCKLCMFPLWSIYYLFMLVFNPLGLLKCFIRCVVRKFKRVWSIVCENVSPFIYEWLKEHKSFWKLGLKCGWGLLWSGYVCAVLVGLWLFAFMIGGLLIRWVVEEPMTMKSDLNFDYTEKNPVAYIPLIAYPGASHDIYLEKKPEIGKASGLRVIPLNHKVQVTVSFTLPESDHNQNLGIFQVKVDFLAHDGQTLASSRRPCMLQYRSQPIRLLLTLLQIVPILTGYTSETQDLKINFKGFSERSVPTASLRVIIEQRAEFPHGAGIPEIYTASLLFESELPLLRKFIWFWRKTLFVWISMTVFIMELVFALLCCRPFIFPKLKLREASDGGARLNNLPVQR